MEIDRSVQRENQAKQEVRKVLVEQAQRQTIDKEILERQLTEERIKRHDLEVKQRDLEIRLLKEGNGRDAPFLANFGGDMGRGLAQDAPNSDYTLMVNCLLYLINGAGGESSLERQAPTTDRDITRVV